MAEMTFAAARSYLFVPGDSEKKLEKSAGSDADVLIFDLEDSVVPERKEMARTMVLERLKAHDRAALAMVRMNALDTEWWEEDLKAVLPGRPGGILVPKTLSGGCIAKVAGALDAVEGDLGLKVGGIALGCVATETAASLFTLGTYAGASPRLAMMTWGAEDLAADLGARSNRDEEGRYTAPYRLARTLCLAGAVAAGAAPVDGIYADFRDEAGLKKAAREAVRDGFTAKVAIHPAQVPVINAAFTPSDEDLEEARAIVAAFENAPDAGTLAFEGRMIDRPHLRQAKRILGRAGAAPGR